MKFHANLGFVWELPTVLEEAQLKLRASVGCFWASMDRSRFQKKPLRCNIGLMLFMNHELANPVLGTGGKAVIHLLSKSKCSLWSILTDGQGQEVIQLTANHMFSGLLHSKLYFSIWYTVQCIASCIFFLRGKLLIVGVIKCTYCHLLKFNQICIHIYSPVLITE